MLLLLVLAFVGPEVWVATQFNKEGNILFCNLSLSRVYEMTDDGLVVWSYDLCRDSVRQEFGLPYVVRLSNGNTLITDAQTGRVCEVNRRGKTVWECDSVYRRGHSAYRAGSEIAAMEATNEKILAINYIQKRGKVMELDRDCNIIWQWSYVDDDSGYWGNVAKARRLYNGNTGVLIRKTIRVEQWHRGTRSAAEYQEHREYLLEKYPTAERVEYLELDSERKLVKHRDFDDLAFPPGGTDLLPDGHVLISYDEYGVAEYDTLGRVIWSCQPPESSWVADGSTPKKPQGAWGAFRSSDGNTVLYYPGSWVYIVDSEKKVVFHVESPAIKSRFGIQYVTKRDLRVFYKRKSEDEIDYVGDVLGVVSKENPP